MAKIKGLNDILPPELREAESLPLDDYIGTMLVFHMARELTGTHGVYMRIVVSLPDTDEQFYLATGASQPMEILRWAKENKQFPFIAKLERSGKAIILRGVD